MNTLRSKFSCAGASLLLVSLVAGCSSVPHKADNEATSSARISATPNAAPQRSLTNFTESLRCMDEKLSQYEISGLLVGAQEIKDPSADISGTKDMLLTALSTMTRKSKAIHVVSLGEDLTDVTSFFNQHSDKAFSSPDFFIRIGAPQIDKGVEFKQAGGGLRMPGVFGANLSRDRLASIVSLDLNLGMVRNLQLLPGIYSSNSIAVIRQGSAADVSGKIRKMGTLFQISNDKSEGFHHSVRTLIELGTIELVGRLTQIPYWECLDITATNPAVLSQAQDWFDGLTRKELTLFVQSKLNATGHYKGQVTGSADERLRKSIAFFRQENDLVANGEIDFNLYYKLLLDPAPVASQHLSLLTRKQTDKERNANGFDSVQDFPEAVEVAQNLKIDTGKKLRALDFELLTDHGTKPAVYKAGEAINLEIASKSDAYYSCFYQQSTGEIMKIFPNRFHPSSLVEAGQLMKIPGTYKFSIVADKAGFHEKVMCMASDHDPADKLVFGIGEKDLQPIVDSRLMPLTNLDIIYSYYKNVMDIEPLRKTVTIEVL